MGVRVLLREPDPRPAAVVVLAAGEGTRMRSATPKVLHRLCGRTLLGHVLAAASSLDAERTFVVVSPGRDDVVRTLPPSATAVVQDVPRGTGHALRTALEHPGFPALGPAATVLVVPGDSPLLRPETLRDLLAGHLTAGAAASVLTAEVADPTGYGRVVRGPDGALVRITEHRDADAGTRAVREIAASVYAFRAGDLRDALARIGTANAQREEYLTDAVELLVGAGRPVAAVRTEPADVLGVNDRVQLAAARRALRDRLLEQAMLAGVTVVDPATVWLGVDVAFEPDVVVHQNVQLHGRTRLERGAEVGPDATLRDTVVRAGARVTRAVCTGADIGPGAEVGPFTYLRPGTVLLAGAKAGGFVEMKSAVVGAGSKVPHLSYVGDARIGERSNIGAATVFVNYDGQDKHRTEVGDDVRIGSDTMLVAPVRVGDGAYTAAGSVITEDVPPGALGIGRARQRNVEGWVARRRPPASPRSPAQEQAEERG